MSIFDKRHHYDSGQLLESNVDANPIVQFGKWLEDALADNRISEANAMVLATATKTGVPSARTVLLRQFNQDGFLFFTNYDSRKSQEMTENPHVAAVFFWESLQRQVRLQGVVSAISDEDSDVYFASRPHNSKLASIASAQSSPIASREELDSRFEELSLQHPEGSEIKRPNNWGGYRITPYEFEFWQGRRWRLHDRLLYTLNDSDNWTIKRLAP